MKKKITRETAWLFVILLSAALYAFASRPTGLWAGETFDPGPPPHPRVAARSTPVSATAVPSSSSQDSSVRSAQLDETHVVTRAEREAALVGSAGDSDVRIVPERRNGQEYGSRIMALSQHAFLWKIGLRPGDTLLDVNGHPMRNAEEGLAVRESLRRDPRLELQIERHGRRMRLGVDFE